MAKCKVAVLCSSKRVGKAAEMANSLEILAEEPYKLMLAVRESDYPAYVDEFRGMMNVEIYATPDKNTPVQNSAVLLEENDREFMFAFPDDGIMLTPGWDRLLREAMWPDGIGVVWPRTKNKDGKIVHNCYVMMLTQKWVDTVGYWNWPKLHNYYVDPFVERIAKRIERAKCVNEVTWLHNHKTDVWTKTNLKYGEKDRLTYNSTNAKVEVERAARMLRRVMTS